MSDQKHISPLLDGFTLGEPIHEHHGVICYPAIKENTSKKYIVKKITVPASQAQFDALLLAGAYKDPGDAMEYFRESGESILEEAETLKDLSRIEGFLPYEGWQMEPITRRRLGYEVYLVGSYKRSLDRYMRQNAFTHLQAVNFGLDLCAALSVCRQSGFLYGDLKPSNIYVSEKKEFRIGDLGFISLDALRYASLPERCFSPYTPPELRDPMEAMNLTVDTFAVGMILYQLYNDGILPFAEVAPLETLPCPCHADYEMAEIIMKAIHPQPEQRWTDPKELGKAIAAYMQRNSVNDIPITPFIPVDVKPEDIVVIDPKKPSDNDAASAAETEDQMSHAEEISLQHIDADLEVSADNEEAPETAAESLPSDDRIDTEESIEEAAADAVQEITSVDTLEGPSAQPEGEMVSGTDEKQPIYEDISDEVATIISKADVIIAHEIPEESVFPTEEPPPDPFAFAKEATEEETDTEPADPLMDGVPEPIAPAKQKKTKHFADPSRKNKIRKFLSNVLRFILLGCVCVGGYWYYQNVYLQPVDALSTNAAQNQITVLIDTVVEESLLTVTCTDGNGKRRTTSVQGGKAIFTGLEPSTQYTIQVDMSGFHKLVGETSEVVTTDATTQILSFQAVAGSEDGSVILDFSVDGAEPNFWSIRYLAEGEEEKVETITTHSTMITGLTIGKVYTFTLDGGKNFDLGGNTSVQYLASKLVLANQLTASSSNGTDITVSWNTPGDVVVENWNVRIYDGYGFEEQVTVTENQVLFTGIDPASSYTVEITASGMTQPSAINISSDPICLSDLHVDESAKTKMKVSWSYTGTAPEGGWILNYTVDGSGIQEIPCDKLPVQLAPLIPGANYEFVLHAADERTIFNNRVLHQTASAKPFTEFKFAAENVTFHMLKTPEDENWHFGTISESDFTDTFAAGDSASMVMQSTTDVYVPSNKVNGLFVFRDSYGNVITDLVTEVTYTWKDIWFDGDKKIGEINIPRLPSSPGNYVMQLYFNGSFVTEMDITIQ